MFLLLSVKRGFKKYKQLLFLLSTKTIYLLGRNPSKAELSNITPVDFRLKQISNVHEFLNVLVIFPPFTSDDSPSCKGIYEWFLQDAIKCDKALNKEAVKFPNFQVLGREGKVVWVWSKFTEKPQEVKPRDTISELSLIASPDYFKEKFGTKNEKKIVEIIFNMAREKKYESHKMRMAGVYSEKYGEIILNTGKEVIGNPYKEKGFTYLSGGKMPAPIEKDINTMDFLVLKDGVFDNLPMHEKQDGLSIFAWSILSVFARALPSRFTLALIGDRGSGKNYTRDNIILMLQKKFKHITKECTPGDTWAGFKDDLRDGVSVFYFEEAEGKTYDEQIIKNIRTSTYKEAEIKQMRGASGNIVKTTINFMSYFSYNFKPSLNSLADISRSCVVNYSNSAIKPKNKQEVAKALLMVDLPELGHQCFSYIFYHWKDFLKNYEDARKDFNIFGLCSDNHKISYFSQLYSFYKTTGILSREGLDNYVKYLKEDDQKDTATGYNEGVLNAICNVGFYRDNEVFKRQTIRGLLEDIVFPDEGGYIPYKRQINHFANSYKIKIFYNQMIGDYLVSIPKNNKYIATELKRVGWSQEEAKSYDIVITSEYGIEKQIRIGSQKIWSTCFPIEKVVSKTVFEKWKSFDKENDIRRLYF